MFASATNFHRKSGVAQWRDLRFLPHQSTQKKTGYQNSWYPGGSPEREGVL
jgi:hypothetical protein